MSYSTMTTRSAGYVVPASEYNQFIANDEACAVASFTTKGDLFAATASKAGARLAAGADYFAPNYLASKSNDMTTAPGEIIIKSSGYQYIPNTAAETDICSGTLLGGSLSTTQSLIYKLMLGYTNNKGTTGTFTFKIYFGASGLTIITSALPSNASPGCIWVEGMISANAVTNSQFPSLRYQVVDPTGANAYAGAPPATIAVDSTVNQTVKWTITMSAAHANFLYVVYAASIRMLPVGVMA